MKPLLNIRSIPITIEAKSSRAQLRQSTKQPRVNITRQRGGLDIRRTLPQVKMDSYEMRASMGLKTTPRVIQEKADEGNSDALQGTEKLAQNGDYVADSFYQGGSPIPDLAMSNSVKEYEYNLDYIPKTTPETWVEGGDLSMNYTMDRLNFDWDVSTRPQLEYVPGGVEFTVSQYHEVIIEYVGGPIYAPPSADPDYVPPPSVDAKA
jgi:hypothetical protein